MLWGGPAPPLLEADHEVQSHLVELGAARFTALCVRVERKCTSRWAAADTLCFTAFACAPAGSGAGKRFSQAFLSWPPAGTLSTRLSASSARSTRTSKVRRGPNLKPGTVDSNCGAKEMLQPCRLDLACHLFGRAALVPSVLAMRDTTCFCCHPLTGLR